MDLTSFERLRRFIVGQGETNALTNNEALRRDLLRWIPAVSNLIQSYCDRTFLTTTYTEYFDLDYNQREFFPKAFPVSTLTSVYVDTSGLWDGSESEIDDCWIGINDRSIIMPTTLESVARKAIRAIYTGGIGTSGTQSVFATTGSTGTWTVGKYVYGGTSSALGIVRASSTGSLTVEVLYGVFVAGETLTEYDSESAQGSSDGSATLSSKTSTAVCEAYPEITLACEMQCRFMHAHKMTFEDSSTQRDGQSQRGIPLVSSPETLLRPEVMAMLNDHRRVYV